MYGACNEAVTRGRVYRPRSCLGRSEPGLGGTFWCNSNLDASSAFHIQMLVGRCGSLSPANIFFINQQAVRRTAACWNPDLTWLLTSMVFQAITRCLTRALFKATRCVPPLRLRPPSIRSL